MHTCLRKIFRVRVLEYVYVRLHALASLIKNWGAIIV
jgi:hypothetical protein